MTITDTGLVTVCITEKPIEEVVARASERYDIVRALTIRGLESTLERSESAHLLIEGLLDVLNDPRIPTRDASRALGRVKARMELLAQSGVDVVVLCRSANQKAERSHLLPSLCAAADRIVSDPLAA